MRQTLATCCRVWAVGSRGVGGAQGEWVVRSQGGRRARGEAGRGGAGRRGLNHVSRTAAPAEAMAGRWRRATSTNRGSGFRTLAGTPTPPHRLPPLHSCKNRHIEVNYKEGAIERLIRRRSCRVQRRQLLQISRASGVFAFGAFRRWCAWVVRPCRRHVARSEFAPSTPRPSSIPSLDSDFRGQKSRLSAHTATAHCFSFRLRALDPLQYS